MKANIVFWGTCCLLLGAFSLAHAAPPAQKKPKDTMGTIAWNVAPPEVIILVDGKKIGTAGKVGPHRVKPGQHLIKLIWNKDETEEPVAVKAGETLKFEYTFEDSGKKAPPPQDPPPAD